MSNTTSLSAAVPASPSASTRSPQSTTSSLVRSLQKLRLSPIKSKPASVSTNTLVFKPLPAAAPPSPATIASRNTNSPIINAKLKGSSSEPSSSSTPSACSHCIPGDTSSQPAAGNSAISPSHNSDDKLAIAPPSQIPCSCRNATSANNAVSSGDSSATSSGTVLSPRSGGTHDLAKHKHRQRAALEHTLQRTLKLSVAAMKASFGQTRGSVRLPDGESREEWIVVNANHFFDSAIQDFNACAMFCTRESCPKMAAGGRYTYLWADGVKVKKPIQCAAPEYIGFLFDWIDEQMSQLPNDGRNFSKSHVAKMAQIFKRLFRVYAHIYHSHYDQLGEIGAEPTLNFNFRHLVYFILEFDLVREAELKPLERLIRRFAPDAFAATS